MLKISNINDKTGRTKPTDVICANNIVDDNTYL